MWGLGFSVWDAGLLGLGLREAYGAGGLTSGLGIQGLDSRAQA